MEYHDQRPLRDGVDTLYAPWLLTWAESIEYRKVELHVSEAMLYIWEYSNSGKNSLSTVPEERLYMI